jgi:plasmid stabilization system protein ParE
MRIVFRKEAQRELVEARNFYEQRVEGLGARWLAHVEASLERVQKQPAAFREVSPGIRRVLVQGFPFSVVYRHDDQAIVVLSVFHHRRQPRSVA